MLDYARQRAIEVLKIPRKAVLATADEFITRLWRIAGVNGIPRHILPAVFTETELRSIRHNILLLIGDHEVIYKPEQVIQRKPAWCPT